MSGAGKALGSIVGGVLSPIAGIFGGGKEKEKAPEVTAPTAMPVNPADDPNDPMVRRNKIRKAAEIQSRSGRLSTILSDSSGDTLG